jgi:hypothetical protein
MLYILRLASGNSMLVLAADKRRAREIAAKLHRGESDEVTTVRCLNTFAVQLSPTEDGSLEVAQWDDETLDGILESEYPHLYEAYLRANAEPFRPPSDPKLSAVAQLDVAQLKGAYDRNIEIIRKALQLERKRLRHVEVSPKSSSARSGG